MSKYFFQIDSHIIMHKSFFVARCYVITKDLETENFMMIVEYAYNGSLRHYLNNNFNSMKWDDNLNILQKIACGLNHIHNNGLIHHDFHCGNILSGDDDLTYITDLGLCQPANVKPSQSDYKKIYGVLPYVAPEVLRGREYTQASDIYGFGVVAFEVCTGLPPYHDISHNELLTIRICQGLRPESNYKIPQLILDIINQCWDADPLKRPKAEELKKLFNNLHEKTKYYHSAYDKNGVINKQIEEADKINKQLSSSTTSSSSTSILSYTTHSQA